MNKESKVSIFYEKFYMDDVGKNIPNLFVKNNYDGVSIKSYWGNAIDAFFKYDSLFMITSVHGDFRIVTAYESGDDYKFNQYFLSGVDGKVIKIPKGTWFGIHNLNSTTGAVIVARNGTPGKKQVLDLDIFDWHAKR